MLPTELLEQSAIWHVFFLMGVCFSVELVCEINPYHCALESETLTWKSHPLLFSSAPSLCAEALSVYEVESDGASSWPAVCPTNTTTQINIQNITVQIWLSLQLHRSLNLFHVFVLQQLGNISGSNIYNSNPDDTKQAFIW